MSSRRNPPPSRGRRAPSRGPPRPRNPAPQRPLLTPGRNFSTRQHCYDVDIVQQAGAETTTALNVTFAQMGNFAVWSSVFDQYRIDYLEFSFRPTANATTLLVNSLVPRLVTVIDLDDSVAPASVTALQEYASAMTTLTENLTRRFTPHIRTMIYDGSAAQPAGSVRPCFMDCAQSAIPHYGMKCALDAGAVGQTAFQTWKVDIYAGITFRNVH
jgi:hypothetical protein